MRSSRDRWFADKRRVLRFAALLAVSMFGFNVLFYLWVDPSSFFKTYLNLNAVASAAVLQFFGDEATVTGNSIISPGYSLSIERGCEAIQVSMFFIIAVLAWPVTLSRWRRATGLVVGTVFLLVVNLVRIVSLYYTGVYFPRAFDTMHVDVWQPAFIVLALSLWVFWVWWASRVHTARHDVAV